MQFSRETTIFTQQFATQKLVEWPRTLQTENLPRILQRIINHSSSPWRIPHNKIAMTLLYPEIAILAEQPTHYMNERNNNNRIEGEIFQCLLLSLRKPCAQSCTPNWKDAGPQTKAVCYWGQNFWSSGSPIKLLKLLRFSHEALETAQVLTSRSWTDQDLRAMSWELGAGLDQLPRLCVVDPQRKSKWNGQKLLGVPCLIQDRERHRENINKYGERRREILKPIYQGEKTVCFQGFGKKQIAQHQKWNLWMKSGKKKQKQCKVHSLRVWGGG